MNPNSFNSPRLGVGLSEERRFELQQANKLKQELYAQQKKIQFSNLLERSNEDVTSYIESQENLFISSSRKNAAELDSSSSSVMPVEKQPKESSQNVEVERDDKDGFDYFFQHSFSSSHSPSKGALTADDEILFDPESRTTETLYDHLLNQLRLENRYTKLSPKLKKLCEEIVTRLDSRGYFTAEGSKTRDTAIAAAYPDYDDDTERKIDRFDAVFGFSSTHETRLRMKQALDEYFSTDKSSKAARRWAREEFDSIVGRSTTKEERIEAKKFLDQLIEPQLTSDPLDTLFSHRPTPEDRATAEEALKIVQTLDPPGVGARNFQESLLLRLRDTPYTSELRKIVSMCFDDFCKKKVGTIAEKTGLSAETIAKIYALPYPFEPSPEELFATSVVPTRHIQPEVVVEETRKGRWTARLDESQQDIRLSPEYVKMLMSKAIDKAARDYLRRQYFEAQALIDALSNRNSTLLRVARAIVDFQQEFFLREDSTPQPLTQQQIADKLGLDSSTVSRACNDKWMATPRGLIAFKTFFPKAVTGNVTSANVADLIKHIVDQENKSCPLSDEKIADILKEKFEIDVSRKTVQEHRDRASIPNSRARKQK